jgi:hypothetical protein
MGLRGDLAELPLPHLVEMTSIGGKTGRLVLFDEEDAVAGELTFRAGRLVGARCGELTAEKAFYALLALKTGTFDFDPGADLDEDTFNLPTESLLIEGMRRLDEVYRLRRRLPAPGRVRYLGGEADDPLEARLLGYLGPGVRTVGDIVAGMLVGGDADEYDALQALHRLTAREVVRVERPSEAGPTDPLAGGPPQPELER